MSYRAKIEFVESDRVTEPFTAADVAMMIRKMPYEELQSLAELLEACGVTRPASIRNIVDVLVGLGECDFDDQA